MRRSRRCGPLEGLVAVAGLLSWVAAAGAQSSPPATVTEAALIEGQEPSAATAAGPVPAVQEERTNTPALEVEPPAADTAAEGAPPAASPPSAAVDEREAWGQDSLFGPLREVDHGGYGALVIRASKLKGDTGLFIGGRGGWLINHHLAIGGGGFGQVLSIEDPESEDAYLHFGYGGGFFAYHLFPQYAVHAVVGALVGAGAVAYSQRGEGTRSRDEADAVFVLEPSLDLEINMVSFARLLVGISYRWVADVDLPRTRAKDLSGLAFGAGIEFGYF